MRTASQLAADVAAALEAGEDEDDVAGAGEGGAAEGGLRPLGGVLTVELLALPPAPTVVKGWSIARVMPAVTPPFVVRRLAHPMLGQGAAANAQAIKVRMRVPPGVVVPATSGPGGCPLLVGHWEPAAAGGATLRGRWVTDDVLDAAFDPAQRILSFGTLHTAAHALLVPRWLDFPYRFWSLRPVAPVRRPVGAAVKAAASLRRLPAPVAAATGVAVGARRRLGNSGSDGTLASAAEGGSDAGPTDSPREDGAESPRVGDGDADDRAAAAAPPLAVQAAVLSLLTTRFALDILVEDGLCHLLKPPQPGGQQGGGGRPPLPPELSHLTCDDPTSRDAVWLPPGQLLLRLAQAGVNLLPRVSGRLDRCVRSCSRPHMCVPPNPRPPFPPRRTRTRRSSQERSRGASPRQTLRQQGWTQPSTAGSLRLKPDSNNPRASLSTALVPG